jgi:hypothetical protein
MFGKHLTCWVRIIDFDYKVVRIKLKSSLIFKIKKNKSDLDISSWVY